MPIEVTMKKLFLITSAISIFSVAQANTSSSTGGSAAINNHGEVIAISDEGYVYLGNVRDGFVIVCHKTECTKIKVDDK
jgi:hypothetical protein